MPRNSVPAKVPIPVSILAFALLQFVSGCGEGRPSLKPAKGKVVCNGQPITVGSVTFVPVAEAGTEAGRPATGTVEPDGTFVLTTYDRFDGAAVGQHRVGYIGAEDEEQAESEELAPDAAPPPRRQTQQKPQYVLKGETIVEVKADGDNDFTIEVLPAGRNNMGERQVEY